VQTILTRLSTVPCGMDCIGPPQELNPGRNADEANDKYRVFQLGERCNTG